MVVNGAYWDIRTPRMLTTEQLAHIQRTAPKRMLALADISCDVKVRGWV